MIFQKWMVKSRLLININTINCITILALLRFTKTLNKLGITIKGKERNMYLVLIITSIVLMVPFFLIKPLFSKFSILLPSTNLSPNT